MELRQSYVDKIFSRSSRMTDSIRSAILANCAGVTAAQVYENRTNETDSEGRPPHSVEAVVDGGSNSDIAEQILATVSAGITTYGSVSVDVPGEDDDMIEVCGISYIDVSIYTTTSASEGQPSSYPLRSVEITNRQRAMTSSTRIEVALDD